MTDNGLSTTRSVRRDVVVEPEDVRGIELPLHRTQACEALDTEFGLERRARLLGRVVEVPAAERPRREAGRVRARGLHAAGVVCGVEPETDERGVVARLPTGER